MKMNVLYISVCVKERKKYEGDRVIVREIKKRENGKDDADAEGGGRERERKWEREIATVC